MTPVQMVEGARRWSNRTPAARLAAFAGWLGAVALFVWCFGVMTRTTTSGPS